MKSVRGTVAQSGGRLGSMVAGSVGLWVSEFTTHIVMERYTYHKPKPKLKLEELEVSVYLSKHRTIEIPSLLKLSASLVTTWSPSTRTIRKDRSGEVLYKVHIFSTGSLCYYIRDKPGMEELFRLM